MKMKNNDLLTQAFTKLLAGAVLLAVLVFLPAGTLKFANGWLFMGALFIPMLIIGIVLYVKAPDLLKKRLESKETESEQKAVVAVSGAMFLGGFIMAGLTYRFGWISFPKWAVIIGAVLFLLSYAMYGEVLRENAYLSRVIEVQKGQKVIDTGLYGIVRHPMYSATVLMFLSIPIMLGSVISFVIFLIYPIIIAMRIKNEEKVLEGGLEGYTEYKKKVKSRLIPFIW
jgi:protein-S-isoprenylcysteine O-methyltransferase Ste14